MKNSVNTVQVQDLTPKSERGRLYWLFRNTGKNLRAFAMRHKLAAVIVAVALLFLSFVFRPYWQPVCLEVRKLLFPILLVALATWQFVRRFRKAHWKGRIVVGILAGFLCATLYYVRLGPYEYMKLYQRYQTLNLVTLQMLPVTDHERIQPLNSIRVRAKQAMAENESFTEPRYVRVKEEYRWTMAIEPAYTFFKLANPIREIFNVSGTSPSPNFSRENRMPAVFDVGEGLLLSHNTHTAVLRSFSPWRFLSYEPADVMYLLDDNGRWVEVVTLIHWKGFFFPRPEFGGVEIVRQGLPDVTGTVRRVLFGAGEWISPEHCRRYAYLQRQNLVPFAVSRYMAQSLRFQNGFFAPFPKYHKGDVRIPDLQGDVNKQPFTTYFDFADVDPAQSMLYHYFALEPFDPEKQGLNTSVFVPADGTRVVYVYPHYAMNDALVGVSPVAQLVMESKKVYDWNNSRPVEHRPFIRDIDGKRRFFWLTTVVTFKPQEKTQDKPASVKNQPDMPVTVRDFIAGSIPEIVLTDALYKKPVWIPADDPAHWPDDLQRELASFWKQEK